MSESTPESDRRIRGYELQFRQVGSNNRWISVFSAPDPDEAWVRDKYVRNATTDSELRPADENDDIEWRIVRVIEQVIEPPRTSGEVVAWASGISTPSIETPRLKVAHLLWQVNQGYILAEDRALSANWMVEDPSTMHEDDARELPGWLDLADIVLAAISTEVVTPPAPTIGREGSDV